MNAAVDANALYAAADESDVNHHAALTVLSRLDLRLIVLALIAAEASYLIGQRLGPRAEAQFLRGIAVLDVEAPAPEDWRRMAELVEQYADFPLGGADASVVALCERLNVDTVITFDRRHFTVVRPASGSPFHLLPA